MSFTPDNPPPAGLDPSLNAENSAPAQKAIDAQLPGLVVPDRSPAGSNLLDVLARLQSAGPETGAAEKSALTDALREALAKQLGSGEKADLSAVLKEALAALAAEQLGVEKPAKKPRKKPKAKPKAEAKAKPKAKAKAKAKPKTTAKAKAKPKTTAKAKAKPKTTAKAKAKPKAKKAVEPA